ncbi:MATE family efflux transporter [Geoglobus acetivorans]
MMKTEGVRILLGEPEKAIIKLSIPMMISNLVFNLYNFADGVWVAGLGAESLSAIGLFMPLFLMFISLSMGLGIGASSAISRRIGAKDKRGADNVALHALLMSIAVGIIITSTFFRLEDILSLLGASGEVLQEALVYSRIIVAGGMLIVFNNVAVGILNGEGSAKKTMYANVAGSLMNIILDPILIYWAGMEIAGAAVASVLSMLISTAVIIYWLFFSNRTFVEVKPSHFRLSRKIFFDILRVGIPSAFAMLTMSVAVIVINSLIIRVDSADGVAVFTSAWRFVQFGFIPLFGFAGAATAVIGAAFGARNIDKLERAYRYAIKLGVKIEVVFLTITYLASPYIAMAFTYSQASARLYDDIVLALRILPVFLPFAPLGITTSSMFQGVGRGEYSFVITLMRTILFQITLAYVLGIFFGFGLRGIFTGIATGNIMSGIIAVTWGLTFIKNLRRDVA